MAKASETWQAGLSSVTWVLDQAGNTLLVLGDQAINATVNASKELAQAFVQKLEEFGRPFADLWAQLQQFQSSAQVVLQATVNDPVRFLTNLAAGVGQGIQAFISGLSQQLPQQLLQWLSGGLSTLPPPNDWTDVKQVGGWLLQVFRLGWDNIQSLLVRAIGPGNVALLSQAYSYVSGWVGQGAVGLVNWLEDTRANLTPDQLIQAVKDQGTQFVVRNLVPKAVEFILKKFAVPAVGLISSVYDTVNQVFNSLTRFQGLAQLATQIVGQIGNVVQGQTTQLAMGIRDFLNGLIPVGLGFLASQLGLGSLPRRVADALESARAAPLAAAGRGIDYLGTKARGLLGLNGRPEYQGLLLPVKTFRAGPETHRLWAAERNGDPALLVASVERLIQRGQDLMQRYGNYDTRFVSAARQTAVETARVAARDAIRIF